MITFTKKQLESRNDELVSMVDRLSVFKPTHFVLIEGTHPMSFRPGQLARIEAVEWFANKPCYKVRYPDLFVDYIAISDSANYRLSQHTFDTALPLR